MSSHRCACGNTYRKGTRADVLTRSGAIERRIVCDECARRAVVLVLPKPDEVPCAHCPPGDPKRSASVCAACLNGTVHRAVKGALEPFAKHLRNLARTYKATNNPLCLGLAMAADVLDAARAAGVGDELAKLAVTYDDEGGPLLRADHPSVARAVSAYLETAPEAPGAFDVDPGKMLAATILGTVKVHADAAKEQARAKKKNGHPGVFRPSEPVTLGDRAYALKRSGLVDGEGDAKRHGLSLCSWRMLLVLAQRDPKPTSAEQLGILSGYPSSPYSKGASTFRSGIGALSSRGFVTGSRREYHVTGKGLAAAGELPPPKSGAELLEQARAQVFGAAATMLEVFVSNRARELTRTELEELSGYTGSTYRSGVGRLRTLGLVEGWRLAPELAAALDADGEKRS